MNSSLLGVGFKPRHELAVRENLFGLIADRASIPSVSDGKLGPGVS
jgi:hypothetical protein